MTRSIPDYLRLHIPTTSSPRRRRQNHISKQDAFWKTFADATGWNALAGEAPLSITLESCWQMNSVASIAETEEGPTIDREAATALAKAALAVFEELRQHADHTNGIPTATPASAAVRPSANVPSTSAVAPHTDVPACDSQSLPQSEKASSSKSEEICRHLTQARRAAGAAACAFYTLDANTDHLTLFASSQADKTPRLQSHRRPLSLSFVDIEALTGNFVAVDALTARAGFTIPEPFPAAACLAVEQQGTPLGTLWFFFDDDREASHSEEATLRLTASLISVTLLPGAEEQQLEKAMQAVRPLKTAAQWQRQQLQLGSDLASGWRCGGWIQSPHALASSWFLWDILPDGMLAFVLAEAIGEGLENAMIAATARSAWQSHASYRHDPAQLLQRVNDTLWQTNTAAQPLSILYAQLNPDTGEGAFASAGNLPGLITSRFGYRPLVTPNEPLGTQMDATVRMHQVRLLPGETVVLHTPGLNPDGRTTSRSSEASFQQSLAQWWRGQAGEPLQEALDRFRNELPSKQSIESDRSLIAIQRSAPDRFTSPRAR